MWGALSDERTGLLLVFASAVILGSESRGTHDHMLLSQIRVSPNLEGQVTIFTSPRDRVAQLYPPGTVLCCSAIAAMETCFFPEPLLSNGCSIVAYFAVVA
jgi:hypothetical protein